MALKSALPVPGMAAATIRLVVVDDQPVIRSGLAHELSLNADFLVVAQAHDAASAIAAWRKQRPDVCLLNATTAWLEGIEMTRQVVEAFPGARVLMLTSSSDPADIGLAVRAGAMGCLTKSIGHEELAEAIRGASRGERSTPVLLAASVRLASGPLSPRKLEVLGLIRQGCSNEEIAARLGVGERTIRFHITEILAILHAADRAQAVAIGFERGLLKLSSQHGGA